jgi:hypothetical protein
MTAAAPHTLARIGQPDTAHIAARSHGGVRNAIRYRVRDLLMACPDGLTDDELAALCADLTDIRHSVATRRGEWARVGHVVDTGSRRINARGSRCVVWAWTDQPSAQAGTGPTPGSRGQRGEATTRVDRSTVDVPLLASPPVEHCRVCGTLDGAEHWQGCPHETAAAVAGIVAHIDRSFATVAHVATLFDMAAP